jgi:hypothetical protein
MMNTKLPKLIVIGYGRHGKDTFCEIAQKVFNFNYISSSEFCSENVIYPILKQKYNYNNAIECYNDRHNHRSEWFDIIADHNKNDPSFLGKQILSDYDIYCGLRRKEELHSLMAQNICDYVIWVDASKRFPPEDKTSCTVTPDMADIIIYNNDTYETFERISKVLLKELIIPKKLQKNDKYRSKV